MRKELNICKVIGTPNVRNEENKKYPQNLKDEKNYENP